PGPPSAPRRGASRRVRKAVRSSRCCSARAPGTALRGRSSSHRDTLVPAGQEPGVERAELEVLLGERAAEGGEGEHVLPGVYREAAEQIASRPTPAPQPISSTRPKGGAQAASCSQPTVARRSSVRTGLFTSASSTELSFTAPLLAQGFWCA